MHAAIVSGGNGRRQKTRGGTRWRLARVPVKKSAHLELARCRAPLEAPALCADAADYLTLAGAFSAVSTPIVTTKLLFFGCYQDVHPQLLQTQPDMLKNIYQNAAEFYKRRLDNLNYLLKCFQYFTQSTIEIKIEQITNA